MGVAGAERDFGAQRGEGCRADGGSALAEGSFCVGLEAVRVSKAKGSTEGRVQPGLVAEGG